MDTLTSDLKLADAHREATNEVNRWRGRCLECFVRIEDAAAQTLRALSSSQTGTAHAPPMFGARITELGKVVAEGGALGEKGGGVRKALVELQYIVERRNVLVHGTGTVWIDGGGKWLCRYRFTPSGRGKSEVFDLITSVEADKFEKDIARLARSLSDKLRDLRATIA